MPPPQLILVDEPTGNLNSSTSKEIMALLTESNQKGLTLLVVTHDLEITASCRRVVRMRNGLIVGDGRSMSALDAAA